MSATNRADPGGEGSMSTAQHSPSLRPARARSADAFRAVRAVRRAPTVPLTIVATVALGLGLVAAVFTIFNAFVLRVDAVRGPGELFAVERLRSRGSAKRVRFTRPQHETLRREAGVLSDPFAILPDITTRIDGRMMEGHLVTGNFFDVAGVNAALGRTLTQTDDMRHAGRPVIVFSHNGWSQFRQRPARRRAQCDRQWLPPRDRRRPSCSFGSSATSALQITWWPRGSGHANISTTSRYLKTSRSGLQQYLKRFEYTAPSVAHPWHKRPRTPLSR